MMHDTYAHTANRYAVRKINCPVDGIDNPAIIGFLHQLSNLLTNNAVPREVPLNYLNYFVLGTLIYFCHQVVDTFFAIYAKSTVEILHDNLTRLLYRLL